MKISSREDEEPALNLTPMIDVVFQLLVFFMVATTFLDPEREIEIDLPEAASATVAESEELVINVFQDGSIVMSGQPVSAEDLLDTLKSAAQADPQQPVTIRGDRATAHEHVVRVMDACGRAGLFNLAVGTLEGS